MCEMDHVKCFYVIVKSNLSKKGTFEQPIVVKFDHLQSRCNRKSAVTMQQLQPPSHYPPARAHVHRLFRGAPFALRVGDVMNL